MRIAIAAIIMTLSGLMSVCSAEVSEPKVHVYGLPGNAFANGVSHNGRYAIFSAYREDNTLYDYYGTLVEVGTGKITALYGDGDEVCGALAVSDDGTVAGCYGRGILRSNPAFWKEGKGWTLLPYPEGVWEGGIACSITTDGRYAVGKVYKDAMMWEEPVMWELGDEPTIVPTPGVPYKNRNGVNEHQTRFNSISADGRLISGTVSFSYMGSWGFMYDRETQRVFTPMQDYVDGKFVNRVSGMSLQGARFSADGRYYFGSASWTDEEGNRKHGVYRHEISSGKCTLEEAESLEEGMMAAMDDAGNIYGSAPGGIPVRDWYVLSKGYWVGFDQILRQVYGKELAQSTGYDNSRTGTVMGISGDGKVMGLLVYYQSGETYLLELPESPAALAARVNLLDDYSVAPAEGVCVSSLRDFQFTFTRDMAVYGDNNSVTLLDETGEEIARSIKVAVNPGNNKTIDISFRKTRLEEGKKYRLHLPAGVIGIAGDGASLNREIDVVYSGRADKPVAATEIVPQPGMEIARFTASSNPVVLTFDTNIKTANPSGTFCLKDGDNETKLCDLGFMASGDKLYVWPVADQNLFKGSDYELRIADGTVADVVGENGNEEIVIRYSGAYEPQYNPDDVVLFNNNFDDGSWNGAFLFYEGDHNIPSAKMQGWNFLDGDGYPWWWVRDDEESPDYALASHSMYSPPGKSDDRCVIPRLYIPDEMCRLTFKSQSYLKDKKDRLKVYVWPSDILVSNINDEIAARMADEWELVYDEEQNPGKSEEILAGDWRENSVSLADYAGKNIYIAFVNDNEDESAVFIDDIAVSRNLDFTVSIDVPSVVVDASEIVVKGKVRIENAEEAVSILELTLYDEARNVIDNITLRDFSASQGDVLPFEFCIPLMLRPGCENKFTISIRAGESSADYRGKILNLLFAAEKRVVVEEGTGMSCQNCPMGIVMIDMLKQTYGERLIPIALHTYTGDPLGSGLQGVSSFLGITAYPSAVVNRAGAPVFAMRGGIDGAVFSDAEEPMLWDVVAGEMQQYAIASIEHGMKDGEVDSAVLGDDGIWIPIDICYAADRSNVNDYLLSVLLEDDLEGYQINGVFAYDWPVLGDWGKGGRYGSSYVADYLFQDVARGYFGATYSGTPGLLPGDVRAGRHYYVSMSGALPEVVKDDAKCSVVTMLIDGNTGRVMNAVKSPLKRVAAILQTEENETATSDVYSIDGRCILHNAAPEDLKKLSPGLYIYRGKKIAI